MVVSACMISFKICTCLYFFFKCYKRVLCLWWYAFEALIFFEMLHIILVCVWNGSDGGVVNCNRGNSVMMALTSPVTS